MKKIGFSVWNDSNWYCWWTEILANIPVDMENIPSFHSGITTSIHPKRVPDFFIFTFDVICNTSRPQQKRRFHPKIEWDRIPTDLSCNRAMIDTQVFKRGPWNRSWVRPLKIFSELVVEPTQLKNMLVNLDHFPNFRGENEKYVSCHHPVLECCSSESKTGWSDKNLFSNPQDLTLGEKTDELNLDSSREGWSKVIGSVGYFTPINAPVIGEITHWSRSPYQANIRSSETFLKNDRGKRKRT